VRSVLSLKVNDTRYGRVGGRCVKVYLTDDQVCRLLCIGGQGNLFAVRSIQSMEKAHHERHPSRRTVGASHFCCRRNCRFGPCDPVWAAGRV